MSSTREFPRTPGETFTGLESLLSGNFPPTFAFNGAVINLHWRDKENSLSGKRKVYDFSCGLVGEEVAWEGYLERVYTFEQGDSTVEITVSPRVSLLTDKEAKGGRGDYKIQKEFIAIKFQRGEQKKYYTVDATTNKLPQEIEALLFAMLEAAKTYDPNVGGLNIKAEGYGEKAMKVLKAQA